MDIGKFTVNKNLEYLFVSPVKELQFLNKSQELVQDSLTSVVTLKNNMWVV
jgi:hypothetical protein